MYAKDLRQRFMAITEGYFRDHGYRITKAKFYKKFDDFDIDVLVSSFEPTIDYLETGYRLIAKPSIDFRLMFHPKFCSNLGIFGWNRSLEVVEVANNISSLGTNSCPIHNEKWKISDQTDFDRYRVGIRMRCLEYIEKSEKFQDSRTHFQFVFGSENSKPQHIGGFDARKVALFRLGREYGIDDQNFVWGVETWVGRTRNEYKKLLHWANTPKKPLPPGVKIHLPKNYDPFAAFAKRVSTENLHLRTLAKALGVPEESWTVRNPVTGEFD